jgi:hydrogenase nickel incorporation protein HypA/HybF
VHELSIALSMIEEIEEQMEKRDGAVVEAVVEVVHVRLGVLCGVDPQALRFAFELAREGTVLAAARLEIESIDLLVFCPQCGATHRADPQHILCPHCLTPEQEIIAGRELELRALELSA